MTVLRERYLRRDEHAAPSSPSTEQRTHTPDDRRATQRWGQGLWRPLLPLPDDHRYATSRGSGSCGTGERDKSTRRSRSFPRSSRHTSRSAGSTTSSTPTSPGLRRVDTAEQSVHTSMGVGQTDRPRVTPGPSCGGSLSISHPREQSPTWSCGSTLSAQGADQLDHPGQHPQPEQRSKMSTTVLLDEPERSFSRVRVCCACAQTAAPTSAPISEVAAIAAEPPISTRNAARDRGGRLARAADRLDRACGRRRLRAAPVR